MDLPDNWDSPQNILVVLAHPDDPEFFCGATIAKWTAEGHNVAYCLLTKGDKGVNDHFTKVENAVGILVPQLIDLRAQSRG